MNELAMYPAFLLALRAACHFMIFLRVFTYAAAPGAVHRRTVGVAAALFAGFNLAEFMRILSNFQDFASGSVEPYLPGVMLFVLIFVVWSGGNVARMLPRTIVEKLP